MVEFEEKFNVESSNRAYKDFIEKLRRLLGERSSHNRPTLPIQTNPPTRWFDIVLQTKDHKIRLRLRRGNLYLDGYQMENQQWFEFGSSSTHLINGSNFLGFKGDYADLSGVSGLQMENIKLGQQQLISAVNQLATTTNRQIRAKSSIVVIQMICESIRFIPISDYLTSKFSDGFEITHWMLDLERNWGNLSDALLLADANPGKSFQLPSNVLKIPPIPYKVLRIPPIPPYERKITTLADAADVLGILVGNIYYPDPTHRHGRQ